MNRTRLQATLAAWLGIVLVLSLAACAAPAATGGPSAAGPSDAAATATADASTAAPVTIQVGGKPTADRAEELALFETQVADFEAANPGVTVEGVELEYLDATYAALLASGQLPDVFSVPFTEPQGLFAAGQIADVTDTLNSVGLTDRLNPIVLGKASDLNGRVYGLPTYAYAVGINYNRALFEQAGLDPNDPPDTWDEVRSAAKTIKDKTGAFGFAIMAPGKGGGWSLTALTYAFGGTIETPDGSASALADGATQKALEMIHAMRFEDGSLSDDLLLEWGTKDAEFAAGKFAMNLGSTDGYYGIVGNLGFPASDWGTAGMPDGGGNATMFGGAVWVFNPKSSADELAAAARWVDFAYLTQFTDADAAKAQAASDKAAGFPVGVPFVPLVSDDLYTQFNEAIAEYVDVPVENFQPWVDDRSAERLEAEPPIKAQDVYALLDGIVQTVLSDADADIPALVAEYDGKLNDLLK
jgi:ABC-type glycerol-3-phosphate transport system substrate-binding protein